MKTAFELSKELIQKQTHSMSYDGSEYTAWKKAARAKLCELLGMDKFQKTDLALDIEFEKKEDGYTEYRFTFQSEPGYRVPCHLLIPDGVANPPVMITLQGHSNGMHISLGRPKYPGDEEDIKGGDRDFCVRALKEGYAAIALEQRAFGECGGDKPGTFCTETALTNMLMGRTTIGERVWDISRLIDVLEESFADKVDVKCICLMGNSGGGTATCYTAALEDRLVLAMPSCAMCTYKDSIGAMRHCTCNYIPNIALYFDMGDLMAMAYPKYWVQVSGKEDKIFPIQSAKAVFEDGKKVYDAHGAGDHVTMIEGYAGHRFYADEAWPVVHKYLGR